MKKNSHRSACRFGRSYIDTERDRISLKRAKRRADGVCADGELRNSAVRPNSHSV